MRRRSSRKWAIILGTTLLLALLLASPVLGHEPDEAPRFPYDLVPGYGEDGQPMDAATAIERMVGGNLKSA